MSTLRALIVEDNPDDAALLLRELERIGYEVFHERVETAPDLRDALARESWDVVLSDFHMPELDARRALQVVNEVAPDLAFLIVSGTVGEEAAVEALKAGAQDFLVKAQLTRLGRSIERARREAELRAERRRAEQALRASELRFRRIIEATLEGVWLFDEHGRTAYVNARMAEILGCSQESLETRTLADVVAPEWRENFRIDVAPEHRLLPAQVELRLQVHDDSEVWALVSTNPILDESGAYFGAVAMVRDVTESRKLREQLMISDRMASVGILAAGVAHEINNPLAVTMANLELAASDVADVGATNEAALELVRSEIQEARDAVGKVSNIVHDLKIFSRQDEESRGSVDVHRVLDSSSRMAWNELRHRARLVKEYGATRPVHGNEARLGQVFLNLIVNAAQAIDPGRAAANVVRLRTHDLPGGRIVIEISDTGCGIPREQLGRIFVPFYTTKPAGVGTGLGLPICHRIVTALGGELSVSSEVEAGTTFTVTLPSSADPLPISPARRTSLPPAGRRGSVLVVDDEERVCAVVRRALSGRHEVDTTTRASEALRRISDGARYDVILCDMMMPELTGIDLHRALQQLAPEQASRIIFLTGGVFTPEARRFLTEIDNPVIEKPFEVRMLRDLVAERVDEHPS